MKYKLKSGVKKAVYAFMLMMVLVAIAFAATPTQTFLSDTVSYFKGNVGIGENSPSEELEVDGTVLIDMNTDNIGLTIDSEATSSNNYASLVTTGQGARPMKVRTSDNNRFEVQLDSERTGYFYRNLNSTITSLEVVGIVQDNAADDQNTLLLQNDGSGYNLFFSGIGVLGADFNGKHVDDIGLLGLNDEASITIVTGALAITQSYVRVSPEGAAPDDLNTITGGLNGDIIILNTDGVATINAVDATVGSNTLRLNGNFSMDNSEDTLTLIRSGGVWLELSRSDNR